LILKFSGDFREHQLNQARKLSAVGISDSRFLIPCSIKNLTERFFFLASSGQITMSPKSKNLPLTEPCFSSKTFSGVACP